ncbi:MAG TPA: hypothetical protein VNH18_08025 [Bryobacteraceae bacterium]|nr:hypothetical protein [Bryobacteraceae bacterium]
MTQEFDVWACFVNGRTSWRAMAVVGPVEDAQEPCDGARHMDRVEARSKRHAASIVAAQCRAQDTYTRIAKDWPR